MVLPSFAAEEKAAPKKEPAKKEAVQKKYVGDKEKPAVKKTAGKKKAASSKKAKGTKKDKAGMSGPIVLGKKIKVGMSLEQAIAELGIPKKITLTRGTEPLADSFLIDAFSTDAYGGTGKTADWSGFAEWKSLWPDKEWILAGGLSPENVSRAVAISGAGRVDANSGVESAPGIKDSAKVRAFFASLGAT